MSVFLWPLGPYCKQITHSGASQPRDQPSSWREGKQLAGDGILHLTSSKEEGLLAL